jgi:hypothetical protein
MKKSLKVGVYLFGMALVGLGVAMAATNPGRDAYEQYATKKLSQYLREEVCPQAGETFRSPCNSLVKDNQDQIQKIISENTQRDNFFLWSIYKTDLSLSPLLPPLLGNLLPSYHFETAGVFSGFYIYRTQRR